MRKIGLVNGLFHSRSLCWNVGGPIRLLCQSDIMHGNNGNQERMNACKIAPESLCCSKRCFFPGSLFLGDQNLQRKTDLCNEMSRDGIIVCHSNSTLCMMSYITWVLQSMVHPAGLCAQCHKIPNLETCKTINFSYLW